MHRPRKVWASIAATVLLAAMLLGTLSFFQFGINETEDSAIYMSAASSPSAGVRLTTDVGDPAGTPFTHYPILYPELLRLGRVVGLSYQMTGAVLDFAAYLLLCAGVFWYVGRYARPLWQLLAVVLVVCASPLYVAAALMGPDALAGALMIAAMCCLAEYVKTLHPGPLLLCGVVLATALLLRYASAAFIGAACLTVLLYGGLGWPSKLRSACLLGAISIAPLSCLLLLSAGQGANATDRSLHVHPITAASLHDMVDCLSWVYLPYSVPFGLRVLALIAFGAVAAWLASRSRSRAGIAIPGMFLITYLCFLVISISFFDVATPMDERILSPAVALLCVLVVTACYEAWQLVAAPSARWVRGAVTAALCLFLAIGSSHAFVYLKVGSHGRSLVQLRQTYAALLPVLDSLPADAAVYTNAPFDIYLLTGRHARAIPRKFGYTDLTPLPPEKIERQVEQMRREVGTTKGLIVLKLRHRVVQREHWDAGLMSEAELEKRVPELIRLPDKAGFVVYRVGSFSPL